MPHKLNTRNRRKSKLILKAAAYVKVAVEFTVFVVNVIINTKLTLDTTLHLLSVIVCKEILGENVINTFKYRTYLLGSVQNPDN